MNLNFSHKNRSKKWLSVINGFPIQWFEFPQNDLTWLGWLDCSWPLCAGILCKAALSFSLFLCLCLFMSACFTGWSMRMRWNNGENKQRSSGKVRTCLTHCTLQVERENASSNAFSLHQSVFSFFVSLYLFLFAFYWIDIIWTSPVVFIFSLDHVELLGKLEKKERECETKTQEKEDMMKTLNKMKDKLQREGVELRSAREQVQDLSLRINDISVSSAASNATLQ